jgi:hypothetical protein
MIHARTRPAWLALLAACGLPAWAGAETVIFRNDCRVPIVVQAATVQRGMLKRDQCLLRPGESTNKMPLDTDKIITVCDGKTGQVLFRDALRISKTPLHYSIAPDPRMPGRVRMVPIRPPAGPNRSMPKR